MLTVREGADLVQVDPSDPLAILVAGYETSVAIVAVGDGEYLVRIGERTLRAHAAGDGDRRWVLVDGAVFELGLVTAGAGRARGAAHHHETLTAPMPATVRKIVVEVGRQVEIGDTLLVLEAMKMELPIRAPAAGTVSAIHCREGEMVGADTLLVELD